MNTTFNAELDRQGFKEYRSIATGFRVWSIEDLSLLDAWELIK